jgi:uncharacterized membrane protein
MSELVQFAALLCVAAGLAAAVLTVLTTGDGRLALRVALDFWLAAGLLRLGQAPGWEPLAATAAIIAVRQLAGRALRRPPVRVTQLLPWRQRRQTVR